jgi:hypothetical protein
VGLEGIVRAEDKFWEVQGELIAALGVLGIRRGHKDRLEPFRLLQQIRKLKDADQTARIRACRLITFLVQLKRLGKEPSHKNKKYV